MDHSHNLFTYILVFCWQSSGAKLCRRNLSVTNSICGDTTYVEIPVYSAKPEESVQQKRARLLYQSRKRGIKETDLVLR